MKKTFTNGSLLNIMKLVNSDEGQEFFHKKIPVKILFAFQSNLETIQSTYAVYEDTLKKLSENYNIDLSEEKSLQIKNINNQDFINELNNLLNTKVELDITTISYNDLEKCDENKYDTLTLNDLELISWMIQYEDKEEA